MKNLEKAGFFEEKLKEKLESLRKVREFNLCDMVVLQNINLIYLYFIINTDNIITDAHNSSHFETLR